jgi:hypothetical protein
MSEKDEAVLFECSFTKAEIEATFLALERMLLSGLCPEGLKPALSTAYRAFYSVRTTGQAI